MRTTTPEAESHILWSAIIGALGLHQRRRRPKLFVAQLWLGSEPICSTIASPIASEAVAAGLGAFST